jgi:hypothetical protein
MRGRLRRCALSGKQQMEQIMNTKNRQLVVAAGLALGASLA